MDFKKTRELLIKETKKRISEIIKEDYLITQSINSVHEIDKVANILSKRLREWYGLYNPELSKKISDHEAFIEELLKKNDRIETSMGGELTELDLNSMYSFAESIKKLYDEKNNQISYMKQIMSSFCPNILEITGPLIGAKLIAHKGTLKELAFMPSSTIQLLGAEKALFRHLRSHKKTPKYGYILQHPLVSQSKEKGKAARQLAGKISIAAKKDFFSKENKNDK